MNAYAISRIPEDIFNREHSPVVVAYLARKYGKYGFKRERPIEYNQESKENKYRWVENVTDGLREVGDAHDIIRLNHTGWYNDNYQEETIHGVVYQLTGKDGAPRFVPAVNDPCNDNCALVDFNSVIDDKEDAARWADSMAESMAESNKEYQAKEDAEQRLEDIAEEIKTLYADYRQMIREVRENRSVMDVKVVRELIRKEWHSVHAEVRKLRREATKIEREGMDYGY